VKDGLSTISLDKENCYDNPEYTSDNDKLINLTKDMNKKLKGSITYKFGKQW
jgi:peptidoglycan transpeptidase precursor, ErfK-YbiS-YhnG family